MSSCFTVFKKLAVFTGLGDDKLKKFIERAFRDLKSNQFCGIQIPKDRIPKEYLQKFNIQNAWKYNLPDTWRLIYSIQGGELVIIMIVLE